MYGQVTHTGHKDPTQNSGSETTAQYELYAGLYRTPVCGIRNLTCYQYPFITAPLSRSCRSLFANRWYKKSKFPHPGVTPPNTCPSIWYEMPFYKKKKPFYEQSPTLFLYPGTPKFISHDGDWVGFGELSSFFEFLSLLYPLSSKLLKRGSENGTEWRRMEGFVSKTVPEIMIAC